MLPKMLAELLPQYEPHKRLRGATDNTKIGRACDIPTLVAKRRYTHASNEYNQLHRNFRQIEEESKFKRSLKTFIFSQT